MLVKLKNVVINPNCLVSDVDSHSVLRLKEIFRVDLHVCVFLCIFVFYPIPSCYEMDNFELFFPFYRLQVAQCQPLWLWRRHLSLLILQRK